VGKVADNPRAVGIFGYSYFEENTDRVKALPIDGIEATYDTIASGQYPAARPLYIYVKKAHLDTIQGLRAYLDQWAASWGRDGPLTRIGLVAASERTQSRNKDLLATLEPMTGEGL
jgi:phosphate transport system substrate-binding protein